jgi:hypothetical protein
MTDNIKNIIIMKYIVTRTSFYGDDELKPCEDAVLEKLSNGSVRWYININSLEEMEEFISEVGQIIISYGNEIEIYDSYRE